MEDAVQIMDAEACSMKVPCQGIKSPDVTERELSRHSDKIPPVKPCFKKKHSPKMFDAETLNALRPIFTSFLGSGPLNGIFVPRNQTGDVTNLCEPHVKKGIKTEQQCPQPTTLISGDQSVRPVVDNSLSLHSGQEDLGGETPSVIETSEPTFPSEQNVTAAHTSNESFQDPILQANPEDSTSPVCLDKITENYSNGLFQDSSCLDQYSLNQDNTNTGIFQDKTEEASLLLVFELLNQLQYHVHQNDGIDICVDFLQGLCFYGNDCLKHHTVLPYHWQVRRIDTGLWQSINDDSQEHLERLYCSPDSDRIKMRYQGHDFLADLNCMNVDSLEFDQIRRLSTPSTSSVGSNYHTVWKYFCRDHFGWREYSEPVVKLIEEANCRGLKEVRFVTWHNQYILNIKDGFQQNACFRKEIKRRPLFRSSVMLLPHLQTLSGTTPLTTPAIDSASQVLSPVAITFPNFYPETWIPMDSSQEFVQVPMTNEDKSFRTVYSLFHKTVPETKFRISKIMRVQNLFLWEKYKRKKEFMTRKMTGLDKIMNERHLFHGTSQDVVDGICKHNFDPRVCGKHATMFGQGSYFARKASYSHNFSKRSQKGVHYMFLAKVLTGRYIVGNPTMRRPPPLNPGNITSDLYDSCVDNYFEPQIFVIFNDDQSYPYFIIQYEEVSNTVHI